MRRRPFSIYATKAARSAQSKPEPDAQSTKRGGAMSFLGLLQIYDGDDEATVETAGDRDGVSRSVAVHGGVAGFVKAMSDLVADGRPYDRVVIETHGGPGVIKFNGESVYDITLRDKFKADYRKLFPLYTRLYFNGCNVAEGGDSLGWGFLETAGRMFLAGGGGQVFGHTSPGYAFPGWAPLVGSHTVHFSGETRYVDIARGGAVVKRGSREEDNRKLMKGISMTPRFRR
jgi:hypothetical protein